MGVSLLEHAMKIVEKVLEKRLREIAKIDDMQFSLMPGKDTTDVVFILRPKKKSRFLSTMTPKSSLH